MIVFVDVMTYTSSGIQSYSLFRLNLLRFVWIKTCLYFFDNDVILFEYEYICMFDTAILPILMLKMGLGFLFVLLFYSKPCDVPCGTISVQS